MTESQFIALLDNMSVPSEERCLSKSIIQSIGEVAIQDFIFKNAPNVYHCVYELNRMRFGEWFWRPAWNSIGISSSLYCVHLTDMDVLILNAMHKINAYRLIFFKNVVIDETALNKINFVCMINFKNCRFIKTGAPCLNKNIQEVISDNVVPDTISKFEHQI